MAQATKKRRPAKVAAPPADDTSLALPPTPGLYQSHASALARAANFLHRHWESFQTIIDEQDRDEVIEREITAAFMELNGGLSTLLHQTTLNTSESFTDEKYRLRLKHCRDKLTVHYMAPDTLGPILALEDRSDREYEAFIARERVSAKGGDHGKAN